MSLTSLISETKDEKIRLLTISDTPLSASGIGIQAMQLIKGLLDTGRYRIVSIGGALKHADKRPQVIDEYKEDWIVFPYDGFGDVNEARNWLSRFKPQVMLAFTDPRFFIHLFQIEDEIKDICPLLLWTVWDNDPTPLYNKNIYSSCDDIAFFSKYSYQFHKGIENEVDCDFHCIPLARPENMFKIMPKQESLEYRKKFFGDEIADNFIFLYVGRNARRKRPADILHGFRMFIDTLTEDEIKSKKPFLLLHADPADQEGPNLVEVISHLNLGEYVAISSSKYSHEQMVILYNSVDCVVNFSLNEGFGMPIHESLLCGTPAIAPATGGLTEQMADEDGCEFGVLMDIDERILVGSQLVPYLYEDIVSKANLCNAYRKMYEMSEEMRAELGKKGREYLIKNYKVDFIINSWDEIIQKRVQEYKDPERIRVKLLEL